MSPAFPAAPSADTDWLSLLLEQGPSLTMHDNVGSQEVVEDGQLPVPHASTPIVDNVVLTNTTEAPTDVDLEFLDSLLTDDELFAMPELSITPAADTVIEGGLFAPLDNNIHNEQPAGANQQQQQQPLQGGEAPFTVLVHSSHSSHTPYVYPEQPSAVFAQPQQPQTSQVFCGEPVPTPPASPAVSTQQGGISRSASPVLPNLVDKFDSGAYSTSHPSPATSAQHSQHVAQKKEPDTATSGGQSSSNTLAVNQTRTRAAPLPADVKVKPSSSSSDHESVGFIDITGSPTQREGDSGSEHDKEPETEETKRQVRMQRNRESAQLSRQRKKMQMEDLDRLNQELSAQNKYLTGLISQLTAENCGLRHQLVQVCQQTNTPLPAASSAPPVGAAMPFYGYPGMMPPVPGFGFTPKVPIQKMPTSRPAPAKSEKPVNTKTNKRSANDTASSPSSKRSKAAAGTTVLALCTLFMFSGQLSLFGGGWSGPTQGVDPYAALPDSQAAVRRTLTEVHKNVSSDTKSLNPTEPPHVEGEDENYANTSWANPNSTTWAYLPTQVETALALQPSNADWESLALQKLMDAGSVALMWDPSWAENPVVEELMPEWKNFPSLLGNSFRTEGLLNPIGCEKVFEVDVLSLPDHDKLKRKMHKYLSSMQGFKGRAVPLPPADSAPHPDVSDEEAKPRIGGGSSGGDVVVSVVLPVKPELLGGSGFMAALDRIFVVVLQQSAVYATYSCKLPSIGIL